MQGRIPPADVASGRAAKGYFCNTKRVGFYPSRAGWKVARYNNCAYYNAEPGGLPLGLLIPAIPGVHVLDVSDPTKPVETDFLRTPAMQSPHESMAIDKKRGLLAAVLGNAATAPGILEIYDVKTDCKHPRLVSSLPSSVLGHEGNFSADGQTFYTGSLYAQTLTAVDVSNPLVPDLLAIEHVESHGMSTNVAGDRLYDTVRGDGGGLYIYDTSEIQQRTSSPKFKLISKLHWANQSTPQFAVPVTIKGHLYVIETDEFGGLSNTSTDAGGPIGAARIIDVANDKAPRVVSNVRLEVHMPAVQSQLADEPRSLLGGPYTGHYCSVPSLVDPGILACSMLRSGVRVFDIRDPLHPKEIAYYSPAAAQDTINKGGRNPGFHTGANIEFVPERGEMWLTDQETGFHVVRFTNGVWPFTSSGGTGGGSGGETGGSGTGSGSGSGSGSGGPGSLPSTGLPGRYAGEALLLAAAGALGLRVTRRSRKARREAT
jgi:hypothetical protein